MIKKTVLVLVLLMVAAIIYGYFVLYPQFPIANGYAAKKMCSCTFIAHRSQESIQNEDLGMGPLALTKTAIDLSSKSATSSIFGFAPRTAVYRGDVGCILLDGPDDFNISLKINRPIPSDTELWPKGSLISDVKLPGVNYDQLQQAITNAFDPSMGMDSLKTRAVIVVFKNQLIAEKYARGFDHKTEILGWSMAKSITSTMTGILAKNHLLRLDDTELFPEWEDERSEISLKDLLQMQSGLAFSEEYASISDATRMLFNSEDITSIPKNNRMIHQPGTHWSYSSGTSNLLQGLMRNKFASEEAYLNFPYDSLFNRIGMTSAVLETDESGNFIGSSYCYATPKDWAKFGLLYLNDGNWFGDQIIDSSWVNFVRSPASDSKGIYGGQFWLNVDHVAYPDVPEDLFSANGFQGQHVFIIPSYDLVIVRMGLAEEPVIDFNKFLRSILESIERKDESKTE